MRVKWSALAGLAAMATMVGCEQRPETTAGRVAVVDMERIAAELGKLDALNATRQQNAQAIQVELQGYEKKLNEQIQELAKAAETQPSQENKAKVSIALRQRDMQMNQAMNEARAAMQRIDDQFAASLRKEVTPVASKVAEQHGMTVVLIKDERVLSAGTNCDITTDVIAEMRKTTPSTPTAPTAPPPGAGAGLPMNPPATSSGDAPPMLARPPEAPPAVLTPSPTTAPASTQPVTPKDPSAFN